MTKKQLRKLAIDLLDDDNGINETAWNTLRELLVNSGMNDIVNSVDDHDRFFIYTARANSLREST